MTVTGNGAYQLDPDIVQADYWPFAKAVSTRRTATTQQDRVHAYRAIVDSYTGVLADGLAPEWIHPIRESARRDAIDAVAALARGLVDTDPQQTLELLERACAFDPRNESLYRDVLRLQERLGRLDAMPRTLALLETRLAGIGEHPSPQILALAARLRERHDSSCHSVSTG